MSSSSPWATLIAPIGPVGVGSVLWRSHGAFQVTIVVKAQFALRDHDEAVLLERPPLQLRDQHHGEDPTCSLSNASDVVPFREAADVWLTGHAHAPANRTASVSVVRLGLYCGGDALLDKTLHVMGDRKRLNAPPTPFKRMPLVYERAYGGIGYEDNPVGVGADERAIFPNLLLPDDQERPAGFAPISRYWWLRRRNVSTRLRKRVEARLVDIPDGFDWSYFQAAPADQRVRYLQGDEWMVLDGIHPQLLRVQSRLPRVAGAARVLPLEPTGEDLGDEVAMVADTLAIDADALTCSVTWRGTIPIESELALADMLIAGGLRIGGRAIDWPQAYLGAGEPEEATAPLAAPTLLDHSDLTIVTEEPVPTLEGKPPSSDPLGQTTVDALPVEQLAAQEHVNRRTLDGGDIPPSSVTTVERPRYPRSTPDTEETTDTSVEAIQPSVDIDLGEFTQPLPMVTDTEPGEPPLIPDDELPWVHEPAVEPSVGQGSPRRKKVSIDPAVTLESAIDDDEPLTAIDLPLPGKGPGVSGPRLSPPAPLRRPKTLPARPTPHPPDSAPTRLSEPMASVSDYAPTRPGVSPFGLDSRRGPTQDSSSVGQRPSRPPVPIDSTAFEATLRSAGASDEDIAAMLAALAAEPHDD
jgi:hypothetical protein